MSYNKFELLKRANTFCEAVKLAKKKEEKKGKKEKKDPKAKVRNKGVVVFEAGHKDISDDKDHFPINSEAQARNALARASQYKKVPAWYGGTLKALVKAVAKAVKKKYKGIDVTEAGEKPGKQTGKKKKANINLARLMKTAQGYDAAVNLQSTLQNALTIAAQNANVSNYEPRATVDGTGNVLLNEITVFGADDPDTAALINSEFKDLLQYPEYSSIPKETIVDVKFLPSAMPSQSTQDLPSEA